MTFVRVAEGPAKDLLLDLIPRLDRLAREAARFWLERGPDPIYGGFHGFLDRQGRPNGPTEKGVIQQARHLWTFSTWFERREATARVREVAQSTYRFLAEQLRDPKDDEFFYLVRRQGGVVDRRKLLYAQAFAIYALSTYGHVFQVSAAIEMALQCFASVDRRAHDDHFGGYDQLEEIGWQTPGARKDTNTHIHLLEAYTALLGATQDLRVRERLDELRYLCVERLLQPEGYLHPDFDRGFAPLGAPVVSYGHDLETTWLLLDACRKLGDWPKTVVDGACRMGIHSAAVGFDSRLGGYFENGSPQGGSASLDKVWWPQFEALAGLYWLYRLTGDAVHLTRLNRTLAWLETTARDSQYGEWFWSITPQGTVGPRGDHKGELWKASYHSIRALVFTEDWIRELLAGPSATTSRPRVQTRETNGAHRSGA